MRYLGFLAGVWLVLAIGCRADEAFEKMSGGSNPGYIVPKARADGWIRTSNNTLSADEGKCWVPTKDQALVAEKAVRDFIARAQKDVNVAYPGDPQKSVDFDRRQIAEINQKYPRYGIQFIGVLVNGKKEIFCNYFCRDAIKQLDPVHDFVSLYDGGSCFWHVEYLPDTKTCTGLQINGNG